MSFNNNYKIVDELLTYHGMIVVFKDMDEATKFKFTEYDLTYPFSTYAYDKSRNVQKYKKESESDLIISGRATVFEKLYDDFTSESKYIIQSTNINSIIKACNKITISYDKKLLEELIKKFNDIQSIKEYNFDSELQNKIVKFTTSIKELFDVYFYLKLNNKNINKYMKSEKLLLFIISEKIELNDKNKEFFNKYMKVLARIIKSSEVNQVFETKNIELKKFFD
jgi:hypothetical protein